MRRGNEENTDRDYAEYRDVQGLVQSLQPKTAHRRPGELNDEQQDHDDRAEQ